MNACAKSNTATYDWPCMRLGDTFMGFLVNVKVDGVAHPLDNVTEINMQLRQDDKTGAVLKESILTAGITITDSPNGQFRVDGYTIDETWPAGKHWYDIEIVDPTLGTGGKLTILEGRPEFIQDVTRVT